MNTTFLETKALFELPKNMIYLDGNSLGPLPKSAVGRVADMMTHQWGEMLITGWNKAGWMQQPVDLGNRLGRLIGAEKDHLVVGDTLSIKVYQALASALAMRPDRKVEDVAVTLITEIDYRTGRMHDMANISSRAHAAGALTIWDLAHSAGAIEVDLAKAKADFAVGCTYKYLNGGPGSPGFIYVAPRHSDIAQPALSGWLGHAAPFAFERKYRAGPSIERMRVGTPSVIASASLESALDIWDMVEMSDVRTTSMSLSDLFINIIEASCPMLKLASPRDATLRGSQVSFYFQDGYAAIQALIARGVVGDFRAPNIMRFGFTPLYIDKGDVLAACEIIGDVMQNSLWNKPEYKIKAKVT